MYPLFNGLTNVIKSVNCFYTAVQGTLTSSLPFLAELPPPASDEFTPYEQLTNQEVITWVEANSNLSFFQQILNQRLNELKTPTVVVVPQFI